MVSSLKFVQLYGKVMMNILAIWKGKAFPSLVCQDSFGIKMFRCSSLCVRALPSGFLLLCYLFGGSVPGLLLLWGWQLASCCWGLSAGPVVLLLGCLDCLFGCAPSVLASAGLGSVSVGRECLPGVFFPAVSCCSGVSFWVLLRQFGLWRLSLFCVGGLWVYYCLDLKYVIKIERTRITLVDICISFNIIVLAQTLVLGRWIN